MNLSLWEMLWLYRVDLVVLFGGTALLLGFEIRWTEQLKTAQVNTWVDKLTRHSNNVAQQMVDSINRTGLSYHSKLQIHDRIVEQLEAQPGNPHAATQLGWLSVVSREKHYFDGLGPIQNQRPRRRLIRAR